MSSSIRSSALASAALAAIVLGAASSANASSTPSCPKRSGELYTNSKVRAPSAMRVFHDKKSLYGCQVVSTRWSKKQQRWIKKVSTKRLGRWTTGTKLSFDWYSKTAIWTRPLAATDERPAGYRRLWVARIGGQSIVAGVKARPGVLGPASDGQIDALKVDAGLVAWASGDAAFLIPLQQKTPRFSDGFDAPPVSKGPIWQLGVWPGAGPRLAETLEISNVVGVADECGGGGTATVSLSPADTALKAETSFGWDGRCID
jgi:hypothetical protein